MLLQNPRRIAALSFGFFVATSAAANNYVVTPNAAISGHNVRSVSGLAACKAECDRADWCKSFDYYKREDKCDLSDKVASDVGGLKTDYPDNPYDHYAKNTSRRVTIGDPDAATMSAMLRSLDYDPRRLLAVSEVGSGEILPAKSDTSGEAIITCENKRQSASEDFESLKLFTPNELVFPGSLVWADRQLADGNPAAVGLPINQARLTLLLNIGQDETSSVAAGNLDTGVSLVVQDLNISSAQGAQTRLLDAFFASGKYSAPNLVKTHYAEVESSAEVSVKAGFRAKWGAKSGLLNTDIGVDADSSTLIANLSQVYYSIAVDVPELDQVFAPSVEPGTLAALIDNYDSPPAYISKVDYGRQVLVKMTVKGTHTDSAIEGAFKYVRPRHKGDKVSAKLDAKEKTALDQATFDVFVYGGSSAGKLLTLSGEGTRQKLAEIFSEDIQFTKQSGAVPVAYSVRFLDRLAPATILVTSDYIEHECVERQEMYVHLYNAAAFKVNATIFGQRESLGNVSLPLWTDGIGCCGGSRDVKIPYDATRLRLFAETGTGSELWNKSINPGHCYVFKGTLISKWVDDNSDGSCE